MASSKFARGYLASGAAALLATLLSVGAPSATLAAGSPPTSVDLSTYVRVGRFDLPEPTRTTPPAGSLLAQEVSAVTYNWDTDTLFVVGDGGTSVVQVTKTGQLIDSMSLAAGSSPQGTEFYDTEGLAYVGAGKFVLVEERYRQVSLITYAAGTTLSRSGAQTVKLGTTIGNVGIEGITFDPLTNGYVAVKETTPQGVFQTGIDFAAGTATNGSPATVNSLDLFDPALAGLLDIADVFALSNLPSLAGHADATHLLVLSQESGRVVNVDRNGVVSSSLTIVVDPGNPLSVAGLGTEGVAMDRDGNLYLVSENGGGDSDHPQLWVYAPSSGVNQAPTALVLANQTTSIVENTSTATRLRVADVVLADDGLGTNDFTLTGPDVAFLEVDSTGLYVKAGVVFDYETKTSYSVTVHADDAGVGAVPDASAPFSLTVIDVVNESTSAPNLIVSEVSPWGSGNSPYAADWFEVTNTGATAANIAGWKVDDNSNSSALAVALSGVTSIGPGQSAIFMETNSAATLDAFKAKWFGSHVPAGFAIGSYSGAGVGLSTGGDAINLFDAVGTRVTGVSFGASTAYFSFDNAAGQGTATLPLPAIGGLSVAGAAGAFLSQGAVTASFPFHETGSPGRIANHAPIANAGPDQPTVEATGPAGAAVTLNGSASIDADGDFLAYSWSEGASALATGAAPMVTLSIGAHTVALTAADPFGGAHADTVQITVRDTTGPAISGNPDGMTVEATSSAGAPVSFTSPTAFDLVDGVIAVICDRAPGAVFPLGTTLNVCTATDSRGNRSTSSFRVTVRDTAAPVVTVPLGLTADATSPSGAVVVYAASATDLVGVTSFVCVPASGSTFAIGTTTVDCTATDADGNSTTRSFTVHVNGAAEQLANLLDDVTGVGPGKSLASKVSAALDKVNSGDLNGARGSLDGFIHEVSAQAGKKASSSQALSFIAQATNVKSVLGF